MEKPAGQFPISNLPSSIVIALGALGTGILLLAIWTGALLLENQKHAEDVARLTAQVSTLNDQLNKPKKTTCMDSDSDQKPYDSFVKGRVTVTDVQGRSSIIYDSCFGPVQVGESWCYEHPGGTGNYVNGTQIADCPKGCFDGACIR